MGWLFFSSSLSGTSYKHVPHISMFISANRYTVAQVGLCQLLHSLIQTLLLLYCYCHCLFCGQVLQVLSALATRWVVLSVEALAVITSYLWLHSVSGRNTNSFLLTCFTAASHISSLSNYFSSACHAIFIWRMFLSARLAFGLLSFKCYV